MGGLRNIEANLYVLDPDKERVRYDVIHQIAHSYALINRSRGKVLDFVAEGPDARKVPGIASDILTSPAADVCARYANASAYSRAATLKQMPHATEPVPDLPGAFGPLIKSLYEFGAKYAHLAQPAESKPKTVEDLWREWGWEWAIEARRKP